MNIEADDDIDRSIRAIGTLMRATRRDKGLSIAGLAKAAGVAAGTVSQYERGMGNPTVHTLRKLADVLNLPLTAFASGPSVFHDDVRHIQPEVPAAQWVSTARRGRVEVVRANERRRLHLPGVGPVYDILSPDFDGALLVMHSVFRAGFNNFEQPFKHFGEEAVTLTEGRLEGLIGGVSVTLEAGDTVTFDSSLPHAWRTLGDTNASLYSALTPPALK